MSLAWLVSAAAAASAGCNVPLEHFFRADAAADGSGDAPIDGATGALAQRAYLKASNTGAGDGLGQSVALSADGSTLAVGAPHEASNGTSQANNTAMDAGAVYVFARTGTTWSQVAYLKAAGPDGDDFFGDSVALSGDGATLAVGAYSEDGAATGADGDQTNNDAPAAGAVYVFVRSGASFSQLAYLKASNTDAGDGFGRSVALSRDGATLAVGAPGERSSSMDPQDNTATDAGAVYVFTRDGGTLGKWRPRAYIKPSAPLAFDQFGESVALSGDGTTLAVGASNEASAVTNIGKAYVFTGGGSAWTEQAVQRSTSTDQFGAFGNRVALSDDGATLAVAASRETVTTTAAMPSAAGAVYVFARSGTAWSPQAALEAADPGPDAQFGDSLAISADGTTLVVGAGSEASRATGIGGDQTNRDAAGAGAVYVFARSGAAWQQRAYVKPANTGAGDGFGHSVAVSAAGTTLAAGAPAEDSKASGVDGNATDNTAADAGAAYVFQ
jgi:hypothetical protein